MAENILCSSDDLSNEASVEQFMLNRLLEYLGYKDSQIRPKEAIDKIKVGEGRKHVFYRPDYVLEYKKKPRWVLDAKATTEDIDDWVHQGRSYCLDINGRFKDDNPVRYFVLSNGLRTAVYEWDREDPLLELSFDDFSEESLAFQELENLLAPRAFSNKMLKAAEGNRKTLTLKKVGSNAINREFTWAHNYIYRHEQLGYEAAFMELVKLVFLKISSDKKVHVDPDAHFDENWNIVIPAEKAILSMSHIDSMKQAGVSNPVNSVLFRDLVDDLEESITQHKKKRIFAANEQIRLKASTIEEIVKRFESIDFYSIDEDLNGRIFETFLNATLRGKALGQYFTPRSVVKLAVGLANLTVTKDRCDMVLDGCCGTGGFLIEAMADMWRKADANAAWSNQEKEAMKQGIAEKSIWGIDAARDPQLARIARMNMFLHGDGGSRIYQLDALDKEVIKHRETDDTELQAEKDEFREALGDGNYFDVVLTNPPFATEYNIRESGNHALLSMYEIAKKQDEKTGRETLRPKMHSNVLFMERYYDLLKPGGLLVTVIDDGVLAGNDNAFAREWLRKHFLIRGVISLPGDAFQRSQARVKTSILLMEKRDPAIDQEQPPIFMWYCLHVGLDSPDRESTRPDDAKVAEAALQEIDDVISAYDKYQNGDASIAATNSVPAEAIEDRMDVKAVLLKPGQARSGWEDMGFSVLTLDELAVNAMSCPDRAKDIILKKHAGEDDKVQLARITYDGRIEKGEETYLADIAGGKFFRLREKDLVISNINAINGSVAVVTRENAGLVVTNEYTVLRSKGDISEEALCALLRTSVARADMILLAKGIGRTRVAWKKIKDLELPLIDSVHVTKIIDLIKQIGATERKEARLHAQLNDYTTDLLSMQTNESEAVLEAFKPPK